MIRRKPKKIRRNHEISPDEIFLDSSNLPEFDKDRFEGQIERPISRGALMFAAGIFALVGLVFVYRIGSLQIAEGAKYREVSENNRLHHSLIFAERGALTDREGKLLSWNTIDPNQSEFSLRAYSQEAGLHGLLGYIKYPKKDKFGFYYNTKYEGADGIEKYLDPVLSGENGLNITETSATGGVLSQSMVRPPKKGENVQLSIHEGAQKALYASIQEMARRSGFRGGAGVMLDVETGEVLASVSYPEYDSNVMTAGSDTARIQGFLTDENNPFLDRVASGLYTPGSILKPLFGLAAISEGVITPEKKIESTGELRVPNPYQPGEYTIFKDWKAHGFTNLKEAIAVSSDVYFYQIGGGFPGQKGLGILRLDEYAKMFGFGDSLEGTFFSGKKGIIPTPEWKKVNFKGDIWRVGDTYNTVIGQYGFQVTPIQAARYIAAIANNGKLVTPTIFSAKSENELEAKGLYLPGASKVQQIENVGGISPENGKRISQAELDRNYQIVRD
ncbi:MAG TPA: penicillin-binding transpeptidase domain-containing protein, partial [Candidatus Paceibacterota bacterium]